jgi:hypothetical protein
LSTNFAKSSSSSIASFSHSIDRSGCEKKFKAVDDAFDTIETLYGVGYRFDDGDGPTELPWPGRFVTGQLTKGVRPPSTGRDDLFCRHEHPGQYRQEGGPACHMRKVDS